MPGFQRTSLGQQVGHRRIVAAHAKTRQQRAELAHAAVQPLPVAQRIQPRQHPRRGGAQVDMRVGAVGTAEVQQRGEAGVEVGMQVEAGHQRSGTQRGAHPAQQCHLGRVQALRDRRAVQRQVHGIRLPLPQVVQHLVDEVLEHCIIDGPAGPGGGAA